MEDGDVVRFDYTLWVDGQKKPLDTSMEAVAKEHGIHRDNKAYQPLTVTLGRKQIIPGLEARLGDLKKGKEVHIDLDPKDAYGDRDAKKIKDLPMAEFRKQKVQPQVGMELTYEGQKAVITRVAGGRVRLDMNHDLAGKKLRYDITLRERITDIPAKVEAVCGYLFPMGGQNAKVEDKRIVLELPDQAKFDQSWPQHKFRVLTELRHAAGPEYDIVLTETYPGQKPEGKAKKAKTSKAKAAGEEE